MIVMMGSLSRICSECHIELRRSVSFSEAFSWVTLCDGIGNLRKCLVEALRASKRVLGDYGTTRNTEGNKRLQIFP